MKTHCPISLRMMIFQTCTNGSFQRKGSEIFKRIVIIYKLHENRFSITAREKVNIAQYVSQLSSLSINNFNLLRQR